MTEQTQLLDKLQPEIISLSLKGKQSSTLKYEGQRKGN